MSVLSAQHKDKNKTVTGHLETFEKGCLTDFVNVLNEKHCDYKTHKAMRVVFVHCSLSQWIKFSFPDKNGLSQKKV